jgi:hypothetical protein
MTRVIVDAVTKARLAHVREMSLLCDESGQVLGHFVPAVEESGRSPMEPQISAEEIERRLREGGGRTLAQIMADLDKRA